MDVDELYHLARKLRTGEYDGEDIMYAWIAIGNLIELIKWQEKAFESHPNIDIDIEHIQ